MIESIPRISVLIITYKQEKIIRRTLDSLISQRDYLYEICVSDDCSPDATWDILQDYSNKYPGLFKLNRNKENLMIFENIEKTWEMPTGDIIYQLAGDDTCGENYFQEIINFIYNNNIDYRNELFCIYGDYKCLYPNGDYFIAKSTLINKGVDALRLSIRGLISNRSTCYSINILRKFVKVSHGSSYSVEDVQDRQLQMFSEKSYYIPFLGNIYYTRIGINVHMASSDWLGRVNLYKNTLDFIINNNVNLEKKDFYYLKYLDSSSRFNSNKSIKQFFKMVRYGFCGCIPSLDFRFSKIKRILFAIMRRIPHHKPLKMLLK